MMDLYEKVAEEAKRVRQAADACRVAS